jgi:hypothetical protein
MSRSTISTFQLFQMFPDEATARIYLEGRLWPKGTTCPTCAGQDRITTRKREGFYRCNKWEIVLDMCAGLKYLRNIRGNQPPGDGQMFYFTPYSTGVLNTNTEALASKLGLILGAAGAVKKSNWDSKPAVAGKTFPIKDALKANGARWDGLAKAWTFDTEVALEAALKAIMEVA